MPASPRTAAGRALLARVNDVVEGDLPCSTFLHEVRVMLAAIEAEAGLVTDVAYFKERGWDRLAEAAPQAAPLDEKVLARATHEAGLCNTRAPSLDEEWHHETAQDIAAEYARPAQARPADAALPNKKENAMDLLEAAWGIIANANGGNWETANAEWRDAAIRWREAYFAALAQQPTAAEDA